MNHDKASQRQTGSHAQSISNQKRDRTCLETWITSLNPESWHCLWQPVYDKGKVLRLGLSDSVSWQVHNSHLMSQEDRVTGTSTGEKARWQGQQFRHMSLFSPRFTPEYQMTKGNYLRRFFSVSGAFSEKLWKWIETGFFTSCTECYLNLGVTSNSKCLTFDCQSQNK